MCGKIADIKLPTWHDTGRPRGYAHVSFFNTNSVRAAFELDGDDLNGRYLSIKVGVIRRVVSRIHLVYVLPSRARLNCHSFHGSYISCLGV